MQIAKIENGIVTQVGHYREMFPHTSFPSNGPEDAWLIEQGCKKLNVFKPHDQLTQKTISCAAYDDGEFVSVVEVTDLTAEEIQAAKDSAMAKLRNTRNNLLTASDWTQIADCTISNKTEWATYRQTLRDFPDTIQDARLPVEWPHNPDWVNT